MAKKLNKVQARQAELKRDYMKLYNKLDMYAQAPLQPLANPWQRDINRLQARWETVKSYVRIYQNYQKAVNAFNAEYLQSVQMRPPHTAINTRTLDILKQDYAQFKRQRKAFIAKIQNEADLIDQNIKEMLQEAWDYSKPTHHTASGEQSLHQQIVQIHAIHFNNFYESVIPKEGLARYNALMNVKAQWEEFVKNFDKFIYNSDQQQVQEAWAVLVTILTGDGMRETEIYEFTEEDLYYE